MSKIGRLLPDSWRSPHFNQLFRPWLPFFSCALSQKLPLIFLFFLLIASVPKSLSHTISLWLQPFCRPHNWNVNSNGRFHYCGMTFRIKLDQVHMRTKKKKKKCAALRHGISIKLNSSECWAVSGMRSHRGNSRAHANVVHTGEQVDSCRKTPPAFSALFHRCACFCSSRVWQTPKGLSATHSVRRCSCFVRPPWKCELLCIILLLFKREG